MQMLAQSTSPQLRLIQGRNPDLKMKVGRVSEAYVGKFERENRAKLEELERQREQLTFAAYSVGVAGIIGLTVFSPSAIASLPALGKVLGDLQGASQRFFVMTELIKEFEEEDVAIEVGLKPEGLREVDFFLKFPDKEYILIQLRALGTARVTYREDRQALRFRSKGGGARDWKPDPLIELLEQERWLRKHRTDLLGTSSRDRRRSLAKVIVLMSETILGEHPEHLWDRIDQQNYLIIHRGGTFNLVEKDRVATFIRSYLASRRNPKT